MVSGTVLMWAFFRIIIIALIFGVAWWALEALKIKEPFYTLLRALLILAAAVFVISELMVIGGMTPIVRS